MRADLGYTPYEAPDARELEAMLTAKLLHNFSVQPENAADEHYYNALVLVLCDLMRERRVAYIHETHR